MNIHRVKVCRRGQGRQRWLVVPRVFTINRRHLSIRRHPANQTPTPGAARSRPPTAVATATPAGGRSETVVMAAA